MSDPILTVSDLDAGYDGLPVVFGVSLEVMPGELVAIVGANGAGKTTTMRAVSGLIHPLKGRIIFQGHGHFQTGSPPDTEAWGQLRS